MSPAAHVRIVRRQGSLPDLQPGVERHRLVVELRDTKPVDEQAARAFLRQLADLCRMRPLGPPAALRLEDGGCSAWLHAADGGAQLQIWSTPGGLVTLDLVARRPLDSEQVVFFTAMFFAARHAVAADVGSPGEHWELSAEAPELRQLCEWAIGEARTGRDLARAATLVAGSGLEHELAPALLARLAEGVRQLHAAGDPKLALAHGDGIGEALLRLREAGVDVTAVAPWTGAGAPCGPPEPAGSTTPATAATPATVVTAEPAEPADAVAGTATSDGAAQPSARRPGTWTPHGSPDGGPFSGTVPGRLVPTPSGGAGAPSGGAAHGMPAPAPAAGPVSAPANAGMLTGSGALPPAASGDGRGAPPISWATEREHPTDWSRF